MFSYKGRWNPTAHMFSRDDRNKMTLELQMLDFEKSAFLGPRLHFGIFEGWLLAMG